MSQLFFEATDLFPHYYEPDYYIDARGRRLLDGEALPSGVAVTRVTSGLIGGSSMWS
jgi:hypothetical protein